MSAWAAARGQMLLQLGKGLSDDRLYDLAMVSVSVRMMRIRAGKHTRTHAHAQELSWGVGFWWKRIM